MKSLEDEVNEIFIRHIGELEESKINYEKTIRGLGGDSLDEVEIIIPLEGPYKIKFEGNEFYNRPVCEIINYIRSNSNR